MKTKKTLQSLPVTERLESLAHKVGSKQVVKRLKSGKIHDWTNLKPEDILSFLHQGKLRQEDAMFWLGVLAVSAEEKAKKHQELATTDELTRVFNRRAFIDSLSKELIRLRAKHLQIQQMLAEPISLNLMLVDIDYFKKVNDTYGHLAGDAALKQLAAVLKKQVRGGDSVYRYGGEEFAILLPETDSEAAYDAAERIRKAVQKTSIVIDKEKKKTISITVSIGVATIAGEHLEKIKVADVMIPKLIGWADEALYQAKENGRNQVIVYTKDLKKKKKK